jgi:hypothetical protein
MAAGPLSFYHAPADWLFSAGADLDAGFVRMAVLGSGYTPAAASHAVFADVSAHEIVHANYPAGGPFLSNAAVVRAANAGRLTSDAVSLLILGTPAAAKWAVLYVDATVGALAKPLLAYVDLDTLAAEVTIPAGFEFIVTMPAAGWLNWSL